MRDPDGYEIALQTSIIYIIVDYVRAHRWSALGEGRVHACGRPATRAPHSMIIRLYAKRHPPTRTPSLPTSAISAQ